MLIARLAIRYSYTTIAAITIAVVAISYIHFTQIEIHNKKVFFKISAAEEVKPAAQSIASNMLDGLVSGFMNQNEVMAILGNYDFTKTVARNIVGSPHFSKLDLNSTVKKQRLTHADIFKKCNDNECNVETLRSIIPSFFTVETEVGSGRLILSVTTRSPITTLVLVKAIKEALIKTRLDAAAVGADTAIKETEELIEHSRKGIEEKGGFDKLAQSESLDALIKQSNDKIASISSRLATEKDQFNFQQIRLRESGVTASTDIKGNKKLSYETYSKIAKKIEDIRQNIASINSTPKDARTQSDNLILNQLNAELAKYEADLSRLGHMKRNIAYDDNFINSQINNQSNFEFDYKVTSAKLERMQKEYDVAKKELDELFSKKAMMENEILHLKPDLEYLKLLEGKLVEAKMARSVIKSDVSFEHFGDDVASFRRSSLVQIIIFCFAVAFFTLFVALIGIYLLDDRIFDSFEIEKCCENLAVIGETPTFD